MTEPIVKVGIMSGQEVRFILRTPYCYQGKLYEGEQLATCSAGKIDWNGRSCDELLFTPASNQEGFFELPEVTIGVGFHWERQESQRFPGELRLMITENGLTVVNVVPVETYLASVISSEMSAEASPELLKAHAVISRSWLLNIIQHNRSTGKIEKQAKSSVLAVDSACERIVWYDHQAHSYFDVCADDHCQRYQGITRANNPNVAWAIKETVGEVLTFEGRICDARFSKCCGGMMEEFRYCWEDKEMSYLKAARDSKKSTNIPDLTLESEAQKWIRTSPEAFCYTTDEAILSQVLNHYDRETTDFYRWRVEYTTEELSRIVKLRSGIDFGTITHLLPLERGKSGRLTKLQIVGTKQTMIIGKELEIRRTLSQSHLYSSAFVIDKEDDHFILTGAGWGHGVGLCQIGAAVMGEKGYKYNEILLHYYVGATIEKKYER